MKTLEEIFNETIIDWCKKSSIETTFENIRELSCSLNNDVATTFLELFKNVKARIEAETKTLMEPFGKASDEVLGSGKLPEDYKFEIDEFPLKTNLVIENLPEEV